MPDCVVCQRDRRHDVRRATHIEADTQWLVCDEHRIDPQEHGAYMPLVGRVLEELDDPLTERWRRQDAFQRKMSSQLYLFMRDIERTFLEERGE